MTIVKRYKVTLKSGQKIVVNSTVVITPGTIEGQAAQLNSQLPDNARRLLGDEIQSIEAMRDFSDQDVKNCCGSTMIGNKIDLTTR